MNPLQTPAGRSRFLKSSWLLARKGISEGKVNREYVHAFQCVIVGADADYHMYLGEFMKTVIYVYCHRGSPEDLEDVAVFFKVPVEEVMGRALLPIDNFVSEL